VAAGVQFSFPRMSESKCEAAEVGGRASEVDAEGAEA